MENKSDWTLAILFFVLSVFPLYFATRLAGNPDTLTWMGIYIGVTVFNILFDIGWGKIFGRSTEQTKK